MAVLPVVAFRERIVEKIKQNRVTLIVGETGCGKSSQIPRFLLEEGMEPILCTQPRRLAVVAIARTVAKALDCEVGGDVGYHIGHSNVSDHNSKRSRIVFKTAGVLLEQMRDKGVAALQYKVVILDEVHERSVESDLVLACIKRFLMKKQDFRLVLMSATADIGRYREYFRELGRDERVEVIAIPSSPQHVIYQRNVSYLEEVGNILTVNIDSISSKFSSWNSCADAKLSGDEHHLIHKLILHLHSKEMDIEKGILVFLPTYYALEEQWNHLKNLASTFEVHILHRSIDINQALQAMKASKTRRKVILATNIAESSVTIPHVAYVIDSCRSLQVYWDHRKKTNMPQLVWVSKSQGEQRRGRTGRTCDGEVYRLVPRSFYHSLEEHESPAILRLSLREQVLMICCAESKAINDPKVLLKKVLDPPDTQLVEEALKHLVDINALEELQSTRLRYEPTFYGRLVDGLPLSFEASVLSLKFGEVSLIHEGVLIGIMQDVQPLPIVHPFGNQGLFSSYIDNFFGDESRCSLPLKNEDICMGNLCAFQFWQRIFKDSHRLEQMKQIANKNKAFVSDSLILNNRLEEEWCMLHNLVQSALNHISEIYDDVVSTLHRYRPTFLTKINLPSYFEPLSFSHICQLPVHDEQCQLVEAFSSVNLKDEETNSQQLAAANNACQAVPYVGPRDFKTLTIAENLQKLLKEMKVEQAGVSQAIVVLGEGYTNDITSIESDTSTTLCKFFVNGMCNKGIWCEFSHSLQAERPLCKFFLSPQGCRNGELCFYSHDLGAGPCVSYSSPRLLSSPKESLQEDKTTSIHTFINSLTRSQAAYILILSDKDLTFPSKLTRYNNTRKLITTTSLTFSAESASLVPGASIIWDVTDISCVITEANGKQLPVPWSEVGCVVWCVDFDAKETSWRTEIHEFFEKLAVRALVNKLYNLRVVLTMNNVNFAQFQVERLARETFFFLIESFPFDEEKLLTFNHVYGPLRPMQVSSPISYVFDLHLPAYAT
ncbi:RNA helicase family protein [Rhynchospora pubera]|uniref:RNA helicase family protein n=1 Tax=Rhynchospora pubera TaxID=906938 RepID=A0AAV8EV28_9POAL|nr:RNA helicase family protein [Rhynchospora pubera]